MYQRLLKLIFVVAMLATSTGLSAQIDGYEVGDKGYLCSPMESASGIVMTNNLASEFYILQDNQLKTIYSGINCGMYANMSKDGKYIGFKSFNETTEQAPAIIEVATGKVTILDEYIDQCGQVSFSDDGTIAYTMGQYLVVRKGDDRKEFDLGFYTNIANISPDGNQVAYSNIDGGNYIIDLQSGAIEQIDATDGYQPIWSPDGKKIAIHTANGTIKVVDRVSNRTFDLGEGQYISWANNSDEIVYTRLNLVGDLQIVGSEIIKAKFDGSQNTTLIASSECLPTSAILTRDNSLVIPYQTGIKRGLAVKNIAIKDGRMNAAAQEVQLISFDENQLVGARFEDIAYRELPATSSFGRYKAPNRAKQTKIPAGDIPYLNQIYSSPAVGGCTAYGYGACAPTSACMYLGYYDLLPKKKTSNRYNGGTDYYAYHIGKSFTNKAGTKTFSATDNYKGCYGIAGAYGYMWSAGSPRSTLSGFLNLNGCTGSSLSESASTTWSRFKSESSAGRPTIICILGRSSSGHVLCGFATNCKYSFSSGSFVEKTGSFVCHDPYGNANNSSWAGYTGQSVTYDWPGYSNGFRNMRTVYYSVISTPKISTQKITASVKSVTLSDDINATEDKYVAVTVTGTDLTQKITFVRSSAAIRPNRQADWDDLKGGTVYFKVNKEFAAGPGTYTGTINPTSGDVSCTIKFTVTLTNSSSTDTPPSSEGSSSVLGDDNLMVDKSYFALEADYGASTQPYTDIKVTGSGLTSDISVNCNSSVITIEKLSGWNATTGGTIRCKLNTNFTLGAGVYETDPDGTDEYFIAVQSTADHRIEIPFTATLKEAGATETTPEIGGETDVVNETPTLKRPWRCDDKKATATQFGWDATKVTAFTHLNGKLYLVMGGTSVKIVDARTGADLGDLNITGISGGDVTISDIQACDGKLVACNRAVESTSGTKGEFKMYVWDTPESAPRLLMSTTNYPSNRIGDCIGFYGTWQNGKFSFARYSFGTDKQTYISEYFISDGVVKTSPESVLPFEADGTAVKGGKYVRVTPVADGWFIDGSNIKTTRLNNSGKALYTIPGTITEGNVFETFTWGDYEFAFHQLLEESTSGTETKFIKGRFELLRRTGNDWSSSLVLDEYPSNGMSDNISNSNARGDVEIATNGADGFEAWLWSAEQGMAYYVCGTPISYDGDATPSDPDVELSINSLDEEWIYSETKGNLTSADWFLATSTDFVRDMCFANGNLYVLTTKSGAPEVVILDAYTGQKKGNLSVEGISGGTFALAGIKSLGNTVIGANYGSPLKIYKWADDSATPELLMEDASHGSLDVGRSFNTWGDMTDGIIAFASPTGVVYYTVIDDVVNSTPKIVYANVGGSNSNQSVAYTDDGSFWVNNKDVCPTHFSATGILTKTLDSDVAGSTYGVGIKAFTYGKRNYIAFTSAVGADWSGGALKLVDVTNESTPIAFGTQYPEAGLGSGNWGGTTGNTAIDYEITAENGLNLWVMVSQQGIAMYKANNPATGVDDFEIEEVEYPVEWYNLQGMPVDGNNLRPGVYIRRQGNDVQKILVK